MAKYNAQIVKEICGYIEMGHTQKDAAALAGITEDTFYRWMKEKSEFSESVERAKRVYKDKLLKVLHISITQKQDARTALEILARRYPDEWGERLKLQHSFDPHQKVKEIFERIRETCQEISIAGLLPASSSTTRGGHTKSRKGKRTSSG